MRHQAEDALRLVEDAGDIASGAVGIGCLGEVAIRFGVPERDPPLSLEPIERVCIREVVAVVMGDRPAQDLSGGECGCEEALPGLHPAIDVDAYEFERR